ncbi:hypothetical protein FCK90_11465 [Kocuria coralli]|uniref:Uncharacterized protein n=1 Tax=Kocuria coralli TaxID=1461025 RepID=A0A5J5KXY2_9MICC|nr:hypothetical protein [Kocuria coralli]KAA9393601.1 hypothetical protein FCK90_11465 [Kocuria coralli]
MFGKPRMAMLILGGVITAASLVAGGLVLLRPWSDCTAGDLSEACMPTDPEILTMGLASAGFLIGAVLMIFSLIWFMILRDDANRRRWAREDAARDRERYRGLEEEGR